MATQRFTRQQFEDALPCDRHSGLPLWTGFGLVDGEYTYRVSVGALADIEVRSSVDASGYARGTGEDSIRAWLVDGKGNPLGSKVQSYVTRVVGWQERLTLVLRTLARRAKQMRPCPVCGTTMGVYKVKKDGPNKGKLFLRCKDECKQFHWVA